MGNPGTICSNFGKQLGKPRAFQLAFLSSCPTESHIGLLFLPVPLLKSLPVFNITECLLGSFLVNHLFSWEKAIRFFCSGEDLFINKVGRAEIIPPVVFYTPCLKQEFLKVPFILQFDLCHESGLSCLLAGTMQQEKLQET